MLDRVHDVTATCDGPGLQTPTEQVVAALWQQITGREYVAGDNFFKTGGDSLAAARVVARLRSFLPVRASLADLFAHPVLADFARHLDGLQDQRRQREQQHLERRRITGSERILMTPAQRLRVATECRAGRERLPRPAGFVPWMIEITAPVSDRAITEALQRLIARHESLRVGFVVDPDSDGGHLFVVDDAEPGLVVEDCGEWPVRHHHDLLAERLSLLTEDPVDLSRPPLWRARLFRFSGNHCALVVVTDHVVMDGISVEVLNNEFHALLNGERLAADNARLDFFDWVHWQRERLSGSSREELGRYWRKRLAGSGLFPDLGLPAPTSGVDGATHHTEALRLSADQTAALLRVATHHGVTSFMICLAAVALSWQRLRGESDTVVHTPVGNRSDPSFAGVVGWLAHTIPIRTVLDPHGSLKGALETVRVAVSDALRHQDMYLDDIAVELGVPPSGDIRPPRIYYGLAETDEPIRVLSGGTSRRLRFPLCAAQDRAQRRALAQFETMSGSGVSIFADISEGRLGLGVVVDPRETDVGFARCLVAAFADVVAELSRLPMGQRDACSPEKAAITPVRPPSTRKSDHAAAQVPGSDGCPISQPC